MKKQTKKQQIKELQEQMWQQVQAYAVDAGQLLDYVSFLSKFYQYSVRNRMLIESQREGAVAVGSFNFFKKNNVKIKKGEHAIKILMPMKVEKFERDGKKISTRYANKAEKQAIKTGQIETSTNMFFTLGNVFDVTQTDLPKEDYPKLFPNLHVDYQTAGNVDYDHAKAILEQVAESIETGVKMANKAEWDAGNAKGYFAPATREIVLNPENTKTESVQVLIHELAHSILHSKEHNAVQQELKIDVHKKLAYEAKELQAEMVAYLVSDHLGIDTEEETTKYISSWTNNSPQIEKENITQLFDETVKVAEYIDEKIDK